jgi:hypothetical protein
MLIGYFSEDMKGKHNLGVTDKHEKIIIKCIIIELDFKVWLWILSHDISNQQPSGILADSFYVLKLSPFFI